MLAHPERKTSAAANALNARDRSTDCEVENFTENPFERNVKLE
jgi:hypothetical protein